MIPLFKIHHPEGIGEKIEEVFRSGFLTEGEYSDRFESELGSFVGTSNTCLTNSCTSALTLACHVCGVGPGDEVISSPMTCMATNEPIIHAGAKIVWADIEPDTGNICAKDVARKVTDKTKAVVGVHWAGQPFDIDAVAAAAPGIPVIQDAAHALGASYKGYPIGSYGDYICFSFQAIKHLTTADGGAICCGKEEDAVRIRKIRWYGLDRQFKCATRWAQDIPEAGYKMHMNNLNAVIGIEQMKTIGTLIDRHKDNGRFYDQNISNSSIEKLRRIADVESAQWIYSILVEDKDDFQTYMKDRGIACDIVHLRNDNYSCVSQFKTEGLTGLDYFDSRLVNIPVGWWVSEADRNKIVDAVNSY